MSSYNNISIIYDYTMKFQSFMMEQIFGDIFIKELVLLCKSKPKGMKLHNKLYGSYNNKRCTKSLIISEYTWCMMYERSYYVQT